MGHKRRPLQAASNNAGRFDTADPDMMDEALALPLNDDTGVFHIAEGLLSNQRGLDENEQRQFADPSLVVRVHGKGPREDLTPPDGDSDGEETIFDELLSSRKKKQVKH